MDLTLVVLAAGSGSRYGGLKQLEPVGPSGETLFEYSVYDALQTGFARVVLVVRAEREALFRASFDQAMARRIPVVYVHQKVGDLPRGIAPPSGRVKPWGTGEAILAAAREVDGPFAVINADDFYGGESFAALARFLAETRESDVPTFAMVGFAVGPTLTEAGAVSRALGQVDGEGYLQRIVEIPEMWKRGDGGVYADASGVMVEVSGEELVSMNMWGFTPALFPRLRDRFDQFLAREGRSESAELYLPEVIQSLVNEGLARVEVLRPGGLWCGITYAEDRRRVATLISELVSRGEYPRQLWG